jgi:hypothetical protein
MTKRIRTQNRNKFRGTAALVGTPARTPQRYGGSPFGSKENRLPCSYVPNLSYISKEKESRDKKHPKHAFARVKDFWSSENTGGPYA